MTIHAMINSRLAEPCLDQLDAEFRAAWAALESEIAAGLWVVTDTGTSIGCTDDPVANRRVGCEIRELPAPESWPVLKDTIVQRMKAQGLLLNLAAMVGTLSAEDRFEFDQSSWFSGSNPRIRAGIVACGGDPVSILAFDPLR